MPLPSPQIFLNCWWNLWPKLNTSPVSSSSRPLLPGNRSTMDGPEAGKVCQDRGPASGAAFQLPLSFSRCDKGATDGSHGRREKTWGALDLCRHIRMLTLICVCIYIYICVYIHRNVGLVIVKSFLFFVLLLRYVFLFNYPKMGSTIASHAHINININISFIASWGT